VAPAEFPGDYPQNVSRADPRRKVISLPTCLAAAA